MTIRVTGVDHAGLVVSDLGAARSLLEDALGFRLEREISVPGRVEAAVLRLGGAAIELMDVSPAPPGEAPVDHVAIEVEDLDAAVAELRARGVETTRPEPSVTEATRSYFIRPETAGGLALQLYERNGNSMQGLDSNILC